MILCVLIFQSIMINVKSEVAAASPAKIWLLLLQGKWEQRRTDRGEKEGRGGEGEREREKEEEGGGGEQCKCGDTSN